MLNFPIIKPTDNLLGRTNEHLGLDKSDLTRAVAIASENDPHPDGSRSSLFDRCSRILGESKWRIEYQRVFAPSLWLAPDPDAPRPRVKPTYPR